MNAPERAVVLVADGRLERDGLLGDLEDLDDALGRRLHDHGQLLGRGLALELLHQLALDAVQLVDRLDHVHGHADRARLVGDAARDRLADPPRRVGRELVAAAPVVLLDGAHQADVALLDEIEEEHAAADVALRDRHHETQVGLDQLAARGRVVALDALRERDLLGGRQQRDAADLAQVGAHRIVRAVAHGHVDRRAGLDLGLVVLVVVVDGDDLEAVRVARRAPLPRRRPTSESRPSSCEPESSCSCVGIVAIQGVSSSDAACPWCVRATGAARQRLELRELPHLLWSYLGCSELLLEGFQSAFDPTRLDAARHLRERLRPPVPCRERQELRLEALLPVLRTGMSSWFSRARTQACASRNSSCVSASGGTRSSVARPRSPLASASASSSRSSRCAASMGSRTRAGGSGARRAPAHRPRDEPRFHDRIEEETRAGPAHQLVALGRRRRVAEDRAQRLVGLVAPVGAADVGRVEHERDAEREHAPGACEHAIDGLAARRRDLGRIGAARGSATRTRRSALVASSRPRSAASLPAVSASKSSTTLRASLRSSRSCGCVSAVPIEATTLSYPAWTRPITSV